MTPDPHPLPGSTGEHDLQRRSGTADRAAAFYRNQVLNRLNGRMAAFVGRMGMVFVSTADGGGECDCSIRCGEEGFVHVLSDRQLCYPEYRGNGVMASLGNLTENGHVGLLFIDFVHDCVGLHVNGRATVVETEAYVHCAKHLPKFAPVPKISWGTDDPATKGGDYFGVAADGNGGG